MSHRSHSNARGNPAPRRSLLASAALALACALPTTLPAQVRQASTGGSLLAAELPDAPGRSPGGAFRVHPAGPSSQPEVEEKPGSISGVVTDIRGGLVPGAEVKLAGASLAAGRSMLSDGDGHFTFADLGPGKYTVTISSPGLETVVLSEIELRAGEKNEIPVIPLPMARTSADIMVSVTPEELAEEEVKAEEKQRVFGVFPNFYTSFVWDAAPLNTRQKFKLALRATVDPVAFVTPAIVAGVETGRNTFPAWGQDASSYGKRYAAAYGDALIGKMIGGALLPSVFRQDPRYFYRGTGTVKARAWHAISSSFLARKDSGGWEPNYSHILGNAAAGAISNVYHPRGDRGGKLVLDNTLIGIAGGAAVNLVREFALRRLTTQVPAYAKGKQD